MPRAEQALDMCRFGEWGEEGGGEEERGGRGGGGEGRGIGRSEEDSKWQTRSH